MFKKILVPVDVENIETQKKALKIAQLMAATTGAEILLLGVIPDIEFQLISNMLPKDIEKKAARIVLRSLQSLADEVSGDRLTVNIHAEYGSIYKTIIHCAESNNVDLIILASHSPTTADYLLGQNSSKVARHSHCSVMIVRP